MLLLFAFHWNHLQTIGFGAGLPRSPFRRSGHARTKFNHLLDDCLKDDQIRYGPLGIQDTFLNFEAQSKQFLDRQLHQYNLDHKSSGQSHTTNWTVLKHFNIDLQKSEMWPLELFSHAQNNRKQFRVNCIGYKNQSAFSKIVSCFCPNPVVRSFKIIPDTLCGNKVRFLKRNLESKNL